MHASLSSSLDRSVNPQCLRVIIRIARRWRLDFIVLRGVKTGTRPPGCLYRPNTVA